MATVIIEGVLQKKGKVNRAWKRRFCALKLQNNNNIVLQYYDSKMDNNLLGTISMSDIYALEVVSDYDLKVNELPDGVVINTTTISDKKYTFLIDTNDRIYVFAAYDPKSYIDWIRMLHKFTYGAIIKQTWLYKYEKKKWKQSYFVLNKCNIKYYEDVKRSKYVGTIKFSDVLCVNEGISNETDYQKYIGYRHVFELVTQKRVWTLCAENDTEKDDWMTQIQSTFKRHRKTTDLPLNTQIKLLEEKLDIKTRKLHLKTYTNSFIGSDVVKNILLLHLASDEKEAVEFGQKLIEIDFITQVENDKIFKNSKLLYQFTSKYHQTNDIDEKETAPIQSKAEMLEKRIEIKNRKFNLKAYSNCFIGSEAIKVMIKLRLAQNTEQAIQFGNRLMDTGLIAHVTDSNSFEDGKPPYFYTFTPKYYKQKKSDYISSRNIRQPKHQKSNSLFGLRSKRSPKKPKSRKTNSLFGSVMQKLAIASTHSDEIDEKLLAINDEQETIEFCNNCDSLQNCKSLKRITHILQFYKENFNDEDKIINHMQKYKHFLNDYHHLLIEHLNEDTMEIMKCDEEFQCIFMKTFANELECDITECKIYLRNHREREQNNIISNHITMEILDSVHCFFIHSVNGGFRFMQQVENDISHLKSYLEQKRKRLENIIGEFRYNKNRFVTNIIPQSTDEKEGSGDQTEAAAVLRHGFGETYDYFSDDNTFFAKYETLKEELIQNAIYSINLRAFNGIYKKAMYLLNHSNFVRSMKSAQFNVNDSGYKYSVDNNVPLEIQNILSVILYSDFDILSYYFKNTFKKWA
eukprot:302231_1